jgi:tRNA G37 N-methylase TrmD
VEFVNPRDFVEGEHLQVDDQVYGG